jgi:hypothetical protein
MVDNLIENLVEVEYRERKRVESDPEMVLAARGWVEFLKALERGDFDVEPAALAIRRQCRPRKR